MPINKSATRNLVAAGRGLARRGSVGANPQEVILQYTKPIDPRKEHVLPGDVKKNDLGQTTVDAQTTLTSQRTEGT
jgi:hypothetical protein